MSRQIPFDEIPEGGRLPNGLATLEIEDAVIQQSGTDKLQYAYTFRAVEPKHLEGMPHYETFTIGTETDKQAEDPSSWTDRSKMAVGTRLWKTMVKAAQVPISNLDEEAILKACVGHRVVAEIENTVEEKEGPYKGKQRCQARRWYPVGTVPMGSGGANPAVVPSAPARPTVVPRPAAR